MFRRLRDAWWTLLGRNGLVPATKKDLRALTAEWREYELELNGYMEKMNAWAARQAKRDKRALDALEATAAETNGQPLELTDLDRKTALRRRAFGTIRGGA